MLKSFNIGPYHKHITLRAENATTTVQHYDEAHFSDRSVSLITLEGPTVGTLTLNVGHKDVFGARVADLSRYPEQLKAVLAAVTSAERWKAASNAELPAMLAATTKWLGALLDALPSYNLAQCPAIVGKNDRLLVRWTADEGQVLPDEPLHVNLYGFQRMLIL